MRNHSWKWDRAHPIDGFSCWVCFGITTVLWWWILLIKILRSIQNIMWICYKLQEKKEESQELLHDNAPIHSSRETQLAIENLGKKPLDHPAYSPDLTPSDFYVFRLLKKHLRGKQFGDMDNLKATVEEFFNTQKPSFFQSAFHELLMRWKKCVETKGSYVVK